MKLSEAKSLISNSTSEDWEKISSSEGYYHTTFSSWSSGDARGVLEDSHHSYAVFRPDARISMAKGLGFRPYSEKWLEYFADKTAHVSTVDCFLCNSLIWRWHVVLVDGARATLPLPKANEVTEDYKVLSWEVTPSEVALARLVNDTFSGEDFDQYFGQSRIQVTPD